MAGGVERRRAKDVVIGVLAGSCSAGGGGGGRGGGGDGGDKAWPRNTDDDDWSLPQSGHPYIHTSITSK